MIKAQTAGLGFRVKSGWAAVVLLTDTAHSLQLSDVSRIELCDPRLPETRQPNHAAMGTLETDSTKVNQRERVVRSISQQSLTRLLKGYRRKRFRIMRAALVVGSQIDPANIANPHIRAHALEGRLFRSAVAETLQDHEIRTEVLLERDAYPSVAARLKISGDRRQQRANHGAQTKSSPRSLRYLRSGSCWNCGNRTGSPTISGANNENSPGHRR